MITFPASPTIGQQFDIPGKSWEWTGVAWNLLSISDAMILAASQSADEAAGSAAEAAADAAEVAAAAVTFSGHVDNLANPHAVTKAQVGLGNVDNTSDADKPTSTATQTALDLKAPLASAALTGTPTAPTATVGTNTTQLATTAFVAGEVAAMVDSSPATLNTLNELAAALGDDPNFAATTAATIGSKAPIASPTFTGTVSGVTAAMVGLGNVDNTSDLNKPVSTAQQAAIDAAIGGGAGMTDADRQNALLNWIYQSKLYAAYRRGIGLFADGFKASGGINTGVSSGYTLDTSTGKAGPTLVVAGQIPQATGTTIGDFTSGSGGGIDKAFDSTSSQAYAASAVAAGASGYVGKNYTSAPLPIASVTCFSSTDFGFDGTGAASTITINLRAKNGSAPSSRTDGTLLGTWTGADATGASRPITSSDTLTYWDYVFIEVSTSAAAQVCIAELQIFAAAAASSATIITTAQTIPSSTKARALIEYNPVDATTLNTDLTVELSCNGGTNYTLATLTPAGVGQSDRLVAETDEVTCTAGTSLVVRTKTLNNKNVQIYGVAATAAA